MGISEKKIETDILNYLSYQPHCFAWKNNSTGIFDPVRKIYRKPKSKYLINGVSDIIGIYKGRPLFLEVKRSHAPSLVRENQRYFLDKTRSLGAISAIVTSVKDVQNLLIKEDEIV